MGPTEKMLLEVPANLASELVSANQEFLVDLLRRGLREVHIERALEHYKQGGISFAAAAEEAGITQPELARAAYVRAIEPPYDEDMLAEIYGEQCLVPHYIRGSRVRGAQLHPVTDSGPVPVLAFDSPTLIWSILIG